ncbi:MAG: hypothetical protein QNJ97_05570 [Myxococcota bacterium]|nr:hypothetical protein [Myxococcota bacterium]
MKPTRFFLLLTLMFCSATPLVSIQTLAEETAGPQTSEQDTAPKDDTASPKHQDETNPQISAESAASPESQEGTAPSEIDTDPPAQEQDKAATAASESTPPSTTPEATTSPKPSEKPADVPVATATVQPIQTLKRQTILPPGYLKNKRQQTWGHVLLGSGAGIIIAGAILTEVDAWGAVGKTGFAAVGGGIGVLVTGMFLLGFSQPVHALKPKRQRLSAAPNGTGGGAITYEIIF